MQWVLLRLTRLQALLLDARRQESHEILVSNDLTILVDDSNRNDVIVSVDLVHQGAHDTKTLFRLDDLF